MPDCQVIYGNCAGDQFPYDIQIAPKKLAAKLPRCYAVEDLNKTATWLELNERISNQTRLVFNRVSSYYKVNSDKARRLERLSEMSKSVSMIDVTPFCESIESLYMTWRYIDRSILGYQHHYAFAGGHYEKHGNKVVSSLDFDLNASKIAPHCKLAKSPIRDKRSIVECQYTSCEHGMYDKQRDVLFSTKTTPQPIITGLADLVHSFETRRSAALDCSTGNSLVVVNVNSYAKWFKDRGRNCCTYAKPVDSSPFDRIVFAEPPIVYTYRRLHIESQARLDCEIIDVRGSSKLDRYLSDRIATETGDIGRFCRILKEKQS